MRRVLLALSGLLLLSAVPADAATEGVVIQLYLQSGSCPVGVEDPPTPATHTVTFCATVWKAHAELWTLRFFWPDCASDPSCPTATSDHVLNPLKPTESQAITIPSVSNGLCVEVLDSGGVRQAVDCV